MNKPPTDAQADFILKEEKNKIELERIATSTRFDYYLPSDIKEWILFLLGLMLIAFVGLRATGSGSELFFWGLLFALTILAEIKRLEVKLDAFVKLSEMRKVEPGGAGQPDTPPVKL